MQTPHLHSEPQDVKQPSETLLRGADRWALSVDKEASGSIGGHYRDVPTGTWERRCGGVDTSGPLMLSSSAHWWEVLLHVSAGTHIHTTETWTCMCIKKILSYRVK